MAVDRTKAEECLLAILRAKGQESGRALVQALIKAFPELDEEQAGEILWGLLDARRVRVNDEAELEADEAIAT